jgi:hypothetical protein
MNQDLSEHANGHSREEILEAVAMWANKFLDHLEGPNQNSPESQKAYSMCRTALRMLDASGGVRMNNHKTG